MIAPFAAAEKTRLMRDGSIHSLGLILSSVAGLLLVPLMVKALGAEAYGLWMSSVATIGLFAAVDLGLRLVIVRELAGEPPQESARLLRGLFAIHTLIGIVAAVAVTTLGRVAASKLHLSAHAAAVAPAIFLLGGASCFFDQIFSYVSAVWAGLRRFHLLNAFSISAALLRVLLFAAALLTGKGVLALAALNLAIGASSALVGLLLVCRQNPSLRPRFEAISGRELWGVIRFGVFAQAATSIASLQMPLSTLLISTINGAASVTPFAVGQKFPDLLSGLTWRSSEVFFPVASRQRRAEQIDTTEFLATISRWLMLVIAPAACGVFLLGPSLLRAWMGVVDPTTLAVLRIGCASVLAETWIPGGIQLLWGAGETSQVLVVNSLTIAANAIFALALIPWVGAAGAAWAIFASTLMGVVLLLALNAARKRVTVSAVARVVSGRVLLALIVAMLPVYILRSFVEARGWSGVVAVIALAVVLYLVCLWTFAARREERALMTSLFGLRRERQSKSRAATL